MTYSVWQAFITDAGEQVVPAATIEVFLESSGATATLYDGPAGAAIGNTTVSGGDGLARFFAPAGTYKIVATKGAFSKEFRHVQLGNAASCDTGTADEHVPTILIADGRYPLRTEIGANDGIAGLDSAGKVPASQLPSYVDDVLMYANFAAFPVSGATGVIYVAEDSGIAYRWTGASYLKISDDDVLEFANLVAFPISGSGATLYIAADTGLVYRWNGAAYVEVGGSGGVSYFESLEYTAAPNNVRYCILWRADPTGGVDADICLQPFGQGALLANPPDGTATYGNKRGVRAVDWQMERIAATQVASGNNSVVGGGIRNSSTGQYCVVGGGYTNTAQGQASVVAGGDTNTITSTGSSYSTISGGKNNNITGTSRQYCTISGGSGNSIAANYAAISGGDSNTISAGATHSVVSGGNAHNISAAGTYATIGGGNGNSASATLATVAGGSSNNGSGQYCGIVGGANNSTAGAYTVAGGQANTVSGSWSVAFGQGNVVSGTHGSAFGAYCDSYLLNGALVHSSGRITTSGDLQTRNVILAARTTNATATVLSVSGAALSAYTQLCPQNHTIQAIRGRCIARLPASSADYAVWEFTAYVKRDSTVASVALLGAVSPTLVHSAGTGNTWTLAVGVDAVTLGSLTVTATGEAAKTIVWGCSLEVLEVQDLS